MITKQQSEVQSSRNGVGPPRSRIPARVPAPASAWWDDPTPRAESHVVTPEIAATILKRNTSNRKPKRSQVAFIADQLRQGLWKENGETIILDESGGLMDGQHRLMACVETGIEMPTLVSFGVPAEAFNSIGRGVRRGNADDLHILGEKHNVNLAATLQLIAIEEAGRLCYLDRGFSFDLIDVLDRHPGVRESVAAIAAKPGIWRGCTFPRRVASFCHYRFHQVDPVKAGEFFERVAHGTNLCAGCPCLALRNRIVGNASSKTKLPAVHWLALMIKAFQFHRRGQSVSNLRWRNEGPQAEDFPII